MHLGKLKDLLLLAVIIGCAAIESEQLKSSLVGSSHFPIIRSFDEKNKS